MKFVSSLRYENHCRLQVVSLKRRLDMRLRTLLHIREASDSNVSQRPPL